MALAELLNQAESTQHIYQLEQPVSLQLVPLSSKAWCLSPPLHANFNSLHMSNYGQSSFTY